MGVDEIPVDARRGEERARASAGTRIRSEGSVHRCPTPAGTIPPLVDDEGVEGRESRE